MAIVVWGANDRAEVSTGDELIELLRRLHRKAEENQDPFSVELTVDNGDTLTAGLGRSVSVLNFVGASGDPPYYQTVGDPAVWPDEIIEFGYRGELTEYPGEAAIPWPAARASLVYFLNTGRRSREVRWEEV